MTAGRRMKLLRFSVLMTEKLEGKTCRELVRERNGEKIGLTDFPWMLSPEGVCSDRKHITATGGGCQ